MTHTWRPEVNWKDSVLSYNVCVCVFFWVCSGMELRLTGLAAGTIPHQAALLSSPEVLILVKYLKQPLYSLENFVNICAKDKFKHLS